MGMRTCVVVHVCHVCETEEMATGQLGGEIGFDEVLFHANPKSTL